MATDASLRRGRAGCGGGGIRRRELRSRAQLEPIAIGGHLRTELKALGQRDARILERRRQDAAHRGLVHVHIHLKAGGHAGAALGRGDGDGAAERHLIAARERVVAALELRDGGHVVRRVGLQDVVGVEHRRAAVRGHVDASVGRRAAGRVLAEVARHGRVEALGAPHAHGDRLHVEVGG